MFGAIFALIILPLFIIGMSGVVFFLSRETPSPAEEGKPKEEGVNHADL